jgi:DNA-binding response OmpR family regulator
MPPRAEPRILVVSHDPQLADVRKSVLEAAGYTVIQARSDSDVAEICREKKPKLVMIGYSLAPSAKRRVWDEARKKCKVPILELHRASGPELMSPAYFHEAHAPDDFLDTVKKILRN